MHLPVGEIGRKPWLLRCRLSDGDARLQERAAEAHHKQHRAAQSEDPMGARMKTTTEELSTIVQHMRHCSFSVRPGSTKILARRRTRSAGPSLPSTWML